jgi:ParB family chromosome partitioning protein
MKAPTSCRTKSTRGWARSRTALAAFENRPLSYQPADIARAGVFVSIDTDGRLAADRGYVRPKDEPVPVGSEDPAAGEIGGAG